MQVWMQEERDMEDNCVLLPTEDDTRLAAYYLWKKFTIEHPGEPEPDADSFWYEAEAELACGPQS